MTVRIVSYVSQLEPAVKRFNTRLKEKNVDFQFPEQSTSTRWPPLEGRTLSEEYFLVVENGLEVRGGYILKKQDFILNKNVVSIGNIQLPLSEGVVNKSYNMVGLKVVSDALRKQPLLYALGMGGLNNPFPALLNSLGWTLTPIPFHFMIIKPNRFFQNIKVLRDTFFRRICLDILAYSGMGWAGVKLFNKVKLSYSIPQESKDYEIMHDFSEWATNLWEGVKDTFIFAAIRDADTLNLMYTPANKKYIRLRVNQGGKYIGWVLLMATEMRNHKQFGDMKVGSIIDIIAVEAKEKEVLSSATKYLAGCGVDLIVTNQASGRYNDALKQIGYMKGPSNFILGTSKKLTELLSQYNCSLTNMHMNRGDGDGPIHL